MNRQNIKREIDLQIIGEWVSPNNRVLDLGCGRGLLLEHLQQTKDIYGVGVDNDFSKILGCVKHGVSAYQGDVEEILRVYPDNFFDWVICSRTVHELKIPSEVILNALRVGKHLAMGFINYGYWQNRLNVLLKGSRVINEVYPNDWDSRYPSNPLSITEFEQFCDKKNIQIKKSVYLNGDWKTRRNSLVNLFAGYAIYDLTAKL